MIFANFDEFLAWFKSLNALEKVDMHEAYTIFLHPETYLEEQHDQYYQI